MTSGRRSGLYVGAVAACSILLSGCLAPNGDVDRVTTFDGPDPAAVQLTSDVVEVYTTAAGFSFVPTFHWTKSTNTLSNVHDALPPSSLPSWVGPYAPGIPTEVWAPTVRFIANRYVLMFSASRPGGAHCIGAAVSSAAEGPFSPVNSVAWCDPNPSVGYLDPQLFADLDGSIWLYWSRQWSANGGSEIRGQQLSSDALSRLGGESVLVSYADVARLASGSLGNNSYVENPAVAIDRHNGYDLLVSIGTWDQPGYREVEIGCVSRTTQCAPSRGGVITLAPNPVGNAAGASFVSDDGRSGAQLVFHGNDPAGSPPRSVFSQSMSPANPG